MNETVDRGSISPESLKEASRYALVIEWSEEDDAFLVTAPDLPGMITHGRTRAEAVEMGEEATAVWISTNRLVGESIPEPRFSALPDYLRPERKITKARRSA